MRIVIKVEDNLKEILTFLEDHGYKWFSGCMITFEEFKSKYIIMERKQIQAGDIIVLTNSSIFTVVEVPSGKYLMPKGSFRAVLEIGEICEHDLSPKPGVSPIKEIRNALNDVVWTSPIEMTVAEIEKALKLNPGTLRIKK